MLFAGSAWDPVLRSLVLYFGAKCHDIILVSKATRLKTRDQKKRRLWR